MLLDNIQLTPDNSEIIIGSYLDLNENPNNLWYGYIDEVRLWDMTLNSDIINFHITDNKNINSSFITEISYGIIRYYYLLDYKNYLSNFIFTDENSNILIINWE